MSLRNELTPSQDNAAPGSVSIQPMETASKLQVMATATYTSTPATIVTSVVTVTPVVTPSGQDQHKVWSIDELPAKCSSRWLLYKAESDTTILTSGNYANTVNNLSLAPAYWRECYPDAPFTPAYSPALCMGQSTLFNVMSSIVPGPTPTTSWSALCCPTYVPFLANVGMESRCGILY